MKNNRLPLIAKNFLSGHPLGTPPYGDDPDDQEWIKKGFEYYKAVKAGCK